MTKQQTNPWWFLDLGFPTTIKEIFIANRHDDTAYELKDFEIRIGNSREGHGMFNRKCGDKHTVKPGGFKTIMCNNTGRYINIHIPGNGKTLSLCEVVPYGMGKNHIFWLLTCICELTPYFPWGFKGCSDSKFGDNVTRSFTCLFLNPSLKSLCQTMRAKHRGSLDPPFSVPEKSRDLNMHRNIHLHRPYYLQWTHFSWKTLLPSYHLAFLVRYLPVFVEFGMIFWPLTVAGKHGSSSKAILECFERLCL